MGGEFIERGVHAVVLHLIRLAGVENGEARVEAGGDGVFAEQALAEAVDGGDPGGFDIALKHAVMAEFLGQLALHVGGGFFVEGDGGVRAGIDLILFVEPAEAFVEDGGFAGGGAGHDTGVEVAVASGWRCSCCGDQAVRRSTPAIWTRAG